MNSLGQEDGSSHENSGGTGSNRDSGTLIIMVILVVIIMFIVLVTMVIVLVAMVIMVVKANKRIGQDTRDIVTDCIDTSTLEVVVSLFGGGAENVVFTSIMGDQQNMEQRLTFGGRTVKVAALGHQGRVGLVSRLVFTAWGRAVGSSLDKLASDFTQGANLVVVVEIVLDILWDIFFGAEVVVSLDNVKILFTPFRGTIGGTSVGCQAVVSSYFSSLAVKKL